MHKRSFVLDKSALYSELFKNCPSQWVVAFLLLLMSEIAWAFKADEVLNKMGDKDKYNYVAGLIDGFAYARFVKDKPDREGMECIHDWYYTDLDESWSSIKYWFARYPDKPAEPLLYVLINRECGT